MIAKFLAILLLPFSASSANAQSLEIDCTGTNAWPTAMAHTKIMNNNGLNSDDFIYEKTKVERIASEKMLGDLYKQVHKVTFFLKNGKKFEVITVNTASGRECSMSDVAVFVIKTEY